MFDHPDFDNHEQVFYCADPNTGLRAILAIHSSALGPAAGGCRMYPYESEQDALTDVLRLSKGMTYKNAVAGLPLGGGKSVIIADPSTSSKPDILRAFSKHVQTLGGRYWTAIDVGVGPEDADVLAENCDYVFARASQYEPGFNPSNFTALGGFVGMKAVATHLWGSDDLQGKRVAIQGLGATGAELARHLHDAGAQLFVSDIDDEKVRKVCDRFAATAVAADDIHAADVDIFSPCAMGAIVSKNSLPGIKAKAICGLANNQLAEPQLGPQLKESGIVYVPDYVVNAGGMMGASTVIFDKPSREKSMTLIHGLYETISTILQKSEETGLSTSDIADKIAEERIAVAQRTKE